MRVAIDTSSIEGYRTFLRIKSLPQYRFMGSTAIVPDEYAATLTGRKPRRSSGGYEPHPALFDYQRDIAAMAIRKGRFAVFADCGLGKTLILLEFARHALAELPRRRVLIVSPLMVIPQTIEEARRFYQGDVRVEPVPAAGLAAWMRGRGGAIGITNYEAITDDVEAGNLGALILDESSMLKSHYGAWGSRLIRLGRGLRFKLALTGTPAPNDRIEYANHAVFLDAFPTVNSFLARFFVNRGQTGERWELKPHALRSFYRALSHWCIFLSNPAVYGWKDNTAPLPPIQIHIHDVPLTKAQRSALMDLRGTLFMGEAGGIGTRAKLAAIGKGLHGVESRKPGFIRDLCASWSDESALVWCRFNAEQDQLASILGAASISGDTPAEERQAIVADFKSGRSRLLVTKPKILGFGLNLQVATRQVFSGLHDSYEEFYQAVKRSNRIGSTRPLNVHIPVTELERPMVENVLAKARRVEADTREQEELFRDASTIAA